MRFPDIHQMREVDPDEDPLKYYQTPGVGWFYFKRLRMAMGLVDGERYDTLLDIGYGSGILLPDLSDRANHVVALDKHGRDDVVMEMLAREQVKADLLHGDLLTLPFADATFDAIICLSVLEHIKDSQAALRELGRVLKPGGRLVIGVPIENWFTDLLFKLIGADNKKYHVARYDHIVNVMDGQYTVDKVVSFPPFIPQSAGLYLAASARKP